MNLSRLPTARPRSARLLPTGLRASLLVLSLGAAALGACSFDASALRPCETDPDCGTGLCIDGYCRTLPADGGVLPDTTAPDTGDASVTPDTPSPADAGDTAVRDTSDASDPGDTIGPSDVGDTRDTGDVRDTGDARDTSDVRDTSDTGGDVIQTTCEPNEGTCDGAVASLCNEEGTALRRLDCAQASSCDDSGAGCRCDEGSCLPRTCRPGAVRCDGDAVQTCIEDGARFSDPVDCPFDDICIGGTCIDAECRPGTVVCTGEAVSRCSPAGRFEVVQDCAAESAWCEDATAGPTCTPRVCEPGTIRCSSLTELERCNDRGSLGSVELCPSSTACVGGSCQPVICTASTSVCTDDFTRLACDETGTVNTALPCDEGNYCDEGACRPQTCAPGARTCSEDDKVLLCDARGSSSSAIETCQYGCDGGECGSPACGDGILSPEAGETCDDQNATLCDGCEGCKRQGALAMPVTSSLNDAARWVSGESDFTIEAWFRSSVGQGGLVGMGGVGEGDYAVIGLREGKPYIRYVLGDGRTVEVVGPTAIADNRWHHIAGVRFGRTSAALYVDGRLVGSVRSDVNRTSIDGAGRIWVGSDGTIARLTGAIDEVRISRRALYVGAFTPPRRLSPTSDTIAHYRLDEASGTRAADSSGARPLALSSPSWIADECYGAAANTSTCGDGRLAPWEQCDDGNRVDGDGCSSTCRAESGCNGQPGFGGSCLLVSPIPLNFSDAQGFCRQWGGNLITIENADENNFLAAFNFLGDTLIGLNDRGDEGTYVWASGSSAGFRSWDNREPNNGGAIFDWGGGEDCAIRKSNARWNDVQCSNAFPFICEK